MKKEIDVSALCRPLEEKPTFRSLPSALNQLVFFFSFALIVFVACDELCKRRDYSSLSIHSHKDPGRFVTLRKY